MEGTDCNRCRPPDPVYTLRGSGSSVTCLKYHPGGQLYSGTADGQVHVWSMNTRRIKTTVQAHVGNSVLWLDFLNKDRLVTLGRNGQLMMWDDADSGWVNNGRLPVSSLGFCGGCVLSQSVVAVPGEAMSQVDLHDIHTMKVTSTLKPDVDDSKFGMCMSMTTCVNDMDKTKLLIGYEDGSIALWDTRQNKMVDCSKQHEDSVMCLGFSDVLSRGYSGSSSNKLCSWNVNSAIQSKDTIEVTNAGFNDVAVRNDGKIVVFAGWDGKVRIFGCKRLKPLAILSYHKESVQCATFSTDNILACGSKDHHISLWDLYR